MYVKGVELLKSAKNQVQQDKSYHFYFHHWILHFMFIKVIKNSVFLCFETFKNFELLFTN